MRYVVENMGWNFAPTLRQQQLEQLERRLDLMDDAAETGQIYVGPEFFERKVLGQLTFYDLCSEDSPFIIPFEIRERVGAAFLKTFRWDESEYWPEEFNVEIDGKAYAHAPDIACSHTIAAAHNDAPGGVIVFSNHFVGLKQVYLMGISKEIYFMCEAVDLARFFRRVIVGFTRNSGHFEEFSNRAFPHLEFASGALPGIDRMSKPYINIISEVVRHLAALSDCGKNVFFQRYQLIQGHFGQLGIDLSDENGNTKANRIAKAQRTRNVGGKEIVFWWHTKIERDRDRIHIHFDIVDGRKRVLVGILCRHLVC